LNSAAAILERPTVRVWAGINTVAHRAVAVCGGRSAKRGAARAKPESELRKKEVIDRVVGGFYGETHGKKKCLPLSPVRFWRSGRAIDRKVTPPFHKLT
jgi:hypothetical protein